MSEQRASVLKNVVSFIVVTEFFESSAYFGFEASLVLFMQVGQLKSQYLALYNSFREP